jgi:hypothetical protein
MKAHNAQSVARLTVQHCGLEFFCNLFIHSFVFVPEQQENGSLADASVSSDRTRKEKLYFVDLAHILKAFRTVGRDYPSSQHMRRNEDTHQWEEVVE